MDVIIMACIAELLLFIFRIVTDIQQLNTIVQHVHIFIRYILWPFHLSYIAVTYGLNNIYKHQGTLPMEAKSHVFIAVYLKGNYVYIVQKNDKFLFLCLVDIEIIKI